MAAFKSKIPSSRLFESRRGRILIENLTAYLFLAPAGTIIFLFGIFPVAFAFFVSLHRWRRFPDEFRGIDSYIEATGNLSFVAFFWLAIGICLFGIYRLWRLLREARNEREALLSIIPGVALMLTVISFLHWFFTLLPFVLEVPERLRGKPLSQQIFVNEFFASFRFPEPLAAANAMWLFVLMGAGLAFIFLRFFKLKKRSQYLLSATIGFIGLALGFLLMRLTLSEIQLAIIQAREAGEQLPIWTQIVIISAGAGLIAGALWLWQKTVAAYTDREFWIRALIVVMGVIGAVLLIMYLPRALAAADDDVLQAFNVTVMYSAFSVPLQLILGLLLAVLLFQNIRGKSFFRVVYFLPYITPFVATSVIFALLFSHRPNSPANQLLNAFNIEDQTWLLEPKGIFQIIFGEIVPDALAGPGLALFVIIMYNVWIYAGYSTVIFLAGLGNIPNDVYEAARIDGANGWQQLRFITLPLLSPTTFFLMLIATIGTFQAFTQIFLMRRPGAYDAVDTINILIFQEIRTSRPDYSYGSAMAFVLFGVILVLTLIQNRIAGRKVFYG